MRPGFGIDQLRIHANLVTSSAYAAFEDVVNTELAADLLHVDRLALVSKSGGAGDHKAPGNPRQIARQIVGDSVRKIFLLGVVRQVAKRQDDDRQARRRFGLGGRRSLYGRSYGLRWDSRLI